SRSFHNGERNRAGAGKPSPEKRLPFSIGQSLSGGGESGTSTPRSPPAQKSPTRRRSVGKTGSGKRKRPFRCSEDTVSVPSFHPPSFGGFAPFPFAHALPEKAGINFPAPADGGGTDQTDCRSVILRVAIPPAVITPRIPRTTPFHSSPPSRNRIGSPPPLSALPAREQVHGLKDASGFFPLNWRMAKTKSRSSFRAPISPGRKITFLPDSLPVRIASRQSLPQAQQIFR